MAYIFNFFITITPNHGIKVDQQYIYNIPKISDPVEKAIKNHSSIYIIKKWFLVSKRKLLSFSHLSLLHDILKEIKTWHQEATQESDIPTKITKQFPCLSVDFLSKNIVLLKVFFAMIFKKVHPTHIKDRKTEKFNYRIASILPNLSSLYERSSW